MGTAAAQQGEARDGWGLEALGGLLRSGTMAAVPTPLHARAEGPATDPASAGASALAGLGSAEEILRLAAASLFDHLSEMCEGILVVDKDANIVWINDRYRRYLPTLGYTRAEEVLGRPVEDVVPNTLMRRVIETGKPILLDIIENQAGSLVVMRIPLHDAAGATIGAVGLILYDHLETLKPLLTRIGKLKSDLAEAQKQLASERRAKYSFANFVGNSAAAQRVKSLGRRAAGLNSTVLLLGETGTGKELLAQAIHAASTRARRPFIAVNVAAIPETLLEAEFFGTAPGAYTGADRRGRDGKFKLADGGTLFLDEIGDMPLALQAKLLRVLQEQEFESLGSNHMTRVDVRIIAATSCDLKTLVEQGRFRADLYYRLNVIPIRLPPLRERREDIGALAEHLLERIAEETGTPPKELSPDALAALAALPWPGNIRELRNVLEAACALNDRIRLTRAELETVLPDLPPTVMLAAGGATHRDEGTLPQRIAALERQAIQEALLACKGNRVQAARQLGIARATLYEKIAQYGLG